MIQTVYKSGYIGPATTLPPPAGKNDYNDIPLPPEGTTKSSGEQPEYGITGPPTGYTPKPFTNAQLPARKGRYLWIILLIIAAYLLYKIYKKHK